MDQLLSNGILPVHWITVNRLGSNGQNILFIGKLPVNWIQWKNNTQVTGHFFNKYSNMLLLRSQETTYITREWGDPYINNIICCCFVLNRHAIYH
jgi:hypothetical protein